MNIILSILIASFLSLIGLIKFQGYFDLGIVNLINIDGTFEVDLSWVKHSVDYFFFIPDTIFNNDKESIREFFSKLVNLQDQEIYIFFIFIFHLILSLIIEVFVRILGGYNFKKVAIFFMILFYLVVIYFARIFTSLF